MFLHTYCHITQIKVNVGDLIFWVYGNSYPNFTKLYCDCVFKIELKLFWNSRNFISPNDPIVENQQTYNHHYKWAGDQHYLERRRRFTLKANSEKSFQPQDINNKLIDVIPYLNSEGISTEDIVRIMCMTKNEKRARNTKPLVLSDTHANGLYEHIYKVSEIKLTGEILEKIHPLPPL